MKFAQTLAPCCLVLFVSSTHAAECMLDNVFYEQKARALAASKPAASLNARTGVVTWKQPPFGVVSVAEGGCQHYGLLVRSSKNALKPMEGNAVMLTARRLVESFWPEPHAKPVAKALSLPPREVRQHAEETVYWFDLTGYDNLTVMHRFSSGTETIEVVAYQP